jgi:hypothetical protein
MFGLDKKNTSIYNFLVSHVLHFITKLMDFCLNSYQVVFRICISFKQIRIQHFRSMWIRVRTQIRIQFQGLDDQKLKKITAENHIV